MDIVVEYYCNAGIAYREGRYLDASRWTRVFWLSKVESPQTFVHERTGNPYARMPIHIMWTKTL